MKRLLAIILLILPLHILLAEDFDLFAPEEKEDPTIYNNLKHNKFYTAYCLYPRENERVGFGYEYFISKKFAVLTEILYKNSITQAGNGERFESNIGVTYRFTKRVVGPVFLGSIGLSLNNDYNNDYGTNRGFRINQLFLKFSAQYSWKNGIGVEYGLLGKMPLEAEFDNNEAQHIFSLFYQF